MSLGPHFITRKVKTLPVHAVAAMYFPEHSSLTLTENIIQSRKDVKGNSYWLVKRWLQCSENLAALTLVLQRIVVGHYLLFLSSLGYFTQSVCSLVIQTIRLQPEGDWQDLRWQTRQKERLEMSCHHGRENHPFMSESQHFNLTVTVSLNSSVIEYEVKAAAIQFTPVMFI